MYLLKKKIQLSDFEKYLFFLIPFSIVLGNFILNLNIIILNIFFLILHLRYIKFNNFFKKITYIFLFFLLINVLFSNFLKISLLGFFGLIKFYIFFIALYFFFLREKDNSKNFFNSIFLAILFVAIDSFIQYLTGESLFGGQKHLNHGERLSGPFGDEYVVGAYLSKLLFLGIFSSYLNKHKTLILLYIFFIYLVILLSQERAAFFSTTISLIFLFIFIKESIFKKFIFVVSFILTIILVSSLNPSFKSQYVVKTLHQLGVSKTIEDAGVRGKFRINSFKDSRHGAHFLTAVEIFKDNIFLGSGVKTFRKACSNDEYKNIESNYSQIRCNTHPHNIHLEVLSETGLVGILFFYFLLIYLFIKLAVKFFYNRENDFVFIFCLLYIYYTPFQTTGSLFSTFNGSFYWISLSIICYILNFNIFKNSNSLK